MDSPQTEVIPRRFETPEDVRENEGEYVFITGRREGELAATVKLIGRNVTGVQGDVSNLGDLDRLFAQKAAVRSFARTWTTDLKDRRIRVNAVSPGPSTRPD